MEFSRGISGIDRMNWLNEQVWVPGDQVVGTGCTCVWLKARSQGRDIYLSVTGGQGHTGAVAVAQPGLGANPEVDVMELANHREGPLARECAHGLSMATGCVCVANVGIHVDEASPEEIATIVDNVRCGLSLMIAELEGRNQNLSTLQETMAAWALEAGQTALSLFRRTGELEFKYDREAVTEADRCIESMLRARISHAFADDIVVGEEFGGDLEDGSGDHSSQKRIWYLDPIDGTLNYALGLPEFCTSITLTQGGKVLGACIAQHISGDVFTAEKGCGAFLNGRPMSVSSRTSLSEAIVSTQFKKESRFVQDPSLLQSLLTGPLKMRRMGAVALELAYVAAGFYDGLLGGFTSAIPMWDVGAGILLIEEAGGIVTNGRGQVFQAGDHEILACNRSIHPQLLARIM
jgi:myo-inositol-1(or 4)-monophosphatase